MPRCKNLFGEHLRNCYKRYQFRYKRKQITRPIPAKAYGTRPPSFASQMNLWHNDDYQRLTVCKFNMHKHKVKIVPFQNKKDYESRNLNCLVTNMRVTPSAQYAMDDMGGFDEYIKRSPPEEIRSCMAEKMKNLMYYYEDNPKRRRMWVFHPSNPEVKSWGMPWWKMIRKKEQKDPMFAKYKWMAFKEEGVKRRAREHKPYSPYYLPKENEMDPARQEFTPGTEDVDVTRNLWWKASPELERRFRQRLANAYPVEFKFADHREPGGFRRGHAMSGGGPWGQHVRLRRKSATCGRKFKFKDTRPY